MLFRFIILNPSPSLSLGLDLDLSRRRLFGIGREMAGFLVCFFTSSYTYVCIKLRPIETKTLKAAVRNIIDPSRDLGHTDRALKAQSGTEEKECKDCQ